MNIVKSDTCGCGVMFHKILIRERVILEGSLLIKYCYAPIVCVVVLSQLPSCFISFPLDLLYIILSHYRIARIITGNTGEVYGDHKISNKYISLLIIG